MAVITADVEQIWQAIEALPPEGREVIWARLANAEAKNGDSTSPKTLLKDERFLISFEDYLALSDDELDEIQIAAYKDHHAWIDHALVQRQAKWILVCGGKIVEWSPTLNDHPSDEKMEMTGMQSGYAPFIFVANPLIEESAWAALA